MLNKQEPSEQNSQPVSGYTFEAPRLSPDKPRVFSCGRCSFLGLPGTLRLHHLLGCYLTVNNQSSVMSNPSKQYTESHLKMMQTCTVQLKRLPSQNVNVSEIWLETLSCGRCLFSASFRRTLRLHQLLGCKELLPETEKKSNKNNATQTKRCDKSTSPRKNSHKNITSHNYANQTIPQHSPQYTTVIDHTSEKSFRCNLCKFTCKKPSHIRSHVLIHTGVKPFSCKVCDYKCNRADNLKGHMIKHSTERPFACSLCSYTCKSKIQMTKHKMVHTDEKLLSCDICSYKCNLQFSLKVHKLTHSDEKPIACTMCNYTCKTPRYLKLHFRAMHRNTPSEKPAK